jgi:hypothetical protein
MHNSKTTELYIRHIGSAAMEVLASEKTATIFSITSRGIFLLLNNNRMIFLSFENSPGPLTATLSGGKHFFSNLAQKGTVYISRHGIQFPDSDINISTSKASVWDPSLPSDHPINPEERLSLIRQLALDAYQSNAEVGICRMLPALVGFEQGDGNLDNYYQGIWRKIRKIRDQLAHRDLIPLIQTLLSLLGMGSGLTPSGDDFAIGLLLLARVETGWPPAVSILPLRYGMLPAARSY